MDKALEFLMENLPVAVALIVMTKMFLNHMKSRDETSENGNKAVAEALQRNTEVIIELKGLIEAMEKLLKDLCQKD